MEEKIYERQVTKQSLSQRVLDEQQVARHFTSADLAELYKFTPNRWDQEKDQPVPVLPKVRPHCACCLQVLCTCTMFTQHIIPGEAEGYSVELLGLSVRPSVFELASEPNVYLL